MPAQPGRVGVSCGHCFPVTVLSWLDCSLLRSEPGASSLLYRLSPSLPAGNPWLTRSLLPLPLWVPEGPAGLVPTVHGWAAGSLSSAGSAARCVSPWYHTQGQLSGTTCWSPSHFWS